MSNINSAAVKQMAATCAALPLLLSGDRKIPDLLVIGGTGYPEDLSDLIGREVKRGRSILNVIFEVNGAEAVIDKMLFFHVTKKQQMWISYCSFVQSEDGIFALRLVGRDQPKETIFRRSSNHLISRPVKNDGTWAMAELNGLQALLAKAASPKCQENTFQVV